jgi:hypothetical protein
MGSRRSGRVECVAIAHAPSGNINGTSVLLDILSKAWVALDFLSLETASALAPAIHGGTSEVIRGRIFGLHQHAVPA